MERTSEEGSVAGFAGRRRAFFPRPHHGLDHVRSLHGIVVLPYTYRQPAQPRESFAGFAVAPHRPGQLLPPPVPVALREHTVVGAGVPEATVNIDRNTARPEHQIRPSSQRRDRGSIDTVTETTPVQLPSERQLRRRVTTGDPAHPFAHLTARRGRPEAGHTRSDLGHRAPPIERPEAGKDGLATSARATEDTATNMRG